MKTTDLKTLQGMDLKEIDKKRDEILNSLSASRMQFRVGRLKNVSVMRNLRKDLAKVLTIRTIKSKSI